MARESGLDLSFMALADPTRRAILGMLSGGEARITELAKPFAISLNSVSKHIRILERARLVTRRREGREHFLSYNGKPLDEVAEFVKAQQAVWTGRLAALDAVLLAEDDAARAMEITK